MWSYRPDYDTLADIVLDCRITKPLSNLALELIRICKAFVKSSLEEWLSIEEAL